jgi:phage gpG-like protein
MVTTIKNQAEFYALLQDVVTDFTNIRFQPLLERGFRMLEEEHGVRFALEVDPEGTPWTPLSQYTVKKKGHAIRLLEAGRLRGSLRDQKHADGIRQTWDEWPNAGLIFGTDVPYGMFHETGGPNLPRRPFMGMAERSLDLFTEHTADYVLAELMQ